MRPQPQAAAADSPAAESLLRGTPVAAVRRHLVNWPGAAAAEGHFPGAGGLVTAASSRGLSPPWLCSAGRRRSAAATRPHPWAGRSPFRALAGGGEGLAGAAAGGVRWRRSCLC